MKKLASRLHISDSRTLTHTYIYPKERSDKVILYILDFLLIK